MIPKPNLLEQGDNLLHRIQYHCLLFYFYFYFFYFFYFCVKLCFCFHKCPPPLCFPLLFFISPTLLLFPLSFILQSLCTPSLPYPTFDLTFHLTVLLFTIYPPPSAHRSRGNLVLSGK
ncbi:hypothetical protein ACN38_g5475 [Penicillium nordicum]|uniref:Uncharacterized protein n=1 Tax=Penicillium nordicum TaxID=229535 RepID=A0A0M8PA95_9EURO|nr:hypothetical protein ACN38_g5475 [Penicillium nordicum]